jgi:hypothetical protein
VACCCFLDLCVARLAVDLELLVKGFAVVAFFGWRGVVLSGSRCPYAVDRGTPKRSAICWTVLSRAS